jgi:energy-coupling factor transporter transmembrane protein EcfT
MEDIPFFLNPASKFLSFFAVTFTDLLHPSPVPHLKVFKVLVIYFPKCAVFRTVQSRAPNIFYIFMYLFMALFNDAVINSEYVASIDSMISQQ